MNGYVEDRFSARLRRLFLASATATAVLAALLLWQIEHVRSIPLTLAIVATGFGVCAWVFQRTGRAFDDLSSHFDGLLTTAAEQSRSAEAAVRMKDEFLATLSHELRTPLNAVLGWARLLDSGKLTPEQSKRAVDAIERAGWAQARVIEDLLDLSQIVGGRIQLAPRATAIDAVVTGVVQSLAAGAVAKQVRLEVAVETPMPSVVVDPDRMRQMLWHLVSNAIKFTPPGGCIEIGATLSDGQLSLQVADDGIGFAADVASHLFERFRQGDSSSTRPYGGLGVGLGMVRHLAELHGGTVTAASDGPGRGSRFTVRLPVREAEASAEATAEVSLRGTTVLAVDDDLTALDFTRTTLERFGARVVTAATVDQALLCLAHEPVDVLVSDLRMPDVDGLELIRRLRQDAGNGWQLPAAALTALARADDRRRALDAGYQAHIAKPVDPRELAATVAWLTQHDTGRDSPSQPAA